MTFSLIIFVYIIEKRADFELNIFVHQESFRSQQKQINHSLSYECVPRYGVFKT